MFTKYFVRGVIEIKGTGGIFHNKPISERVIYRRSFLLADTEDILEVANKDLLRNIERMGERFNRYLSKTKFRVALNYPDGFLREHDEHKWSTKSYSKILSISIVEPMTVNRTLSVNQMTMCQAKEELTVEQWRQMMNQ